MIQRRQRKKKQKSDKANLIIRNRKWNDSTIFELNHKKFEKNDNVSLIFLKNLIDSIDSRIKKMKTTTRIVFKKVVGNLGRSKKSFVLIDQVII